LLAPEPPEPTVNTTFRTPLWLVALFGLMAFWGQLYLDQYGGEFSELVFNQGERLPDVEARVPKSEGAALAVKGKLIFNRYCEACHMPNGRGDASRGFPPLAESEWVLAPGPNRMVRIVLSGFTGPVRVKGADYNNTMLPWRDQLTDEEIAAVLSYVRGNKEWGNHASPVLPAEVKAIRAATESRGTTAWTEPELLAIPEKD
jgi:mono/diheme cytochrome c family protein